MNKNITPNLLPEGWALVSLESIIILEYGKQLTERDRKGQGYAVWGSNGIVGYNSNYLVHGPAIYWKKRSRWNSTLFSG